MKKQQSGFTLIELVMVIVILGILAAFALPKFADLSGDAEVASCRGALGAVKSSAGIAHAAWLAKGSPATVDIEDVTVTIEEGYPAAENIGALANLDGYTLTPATITTAVTVTIGASNFTYTEAATGSVPTYALVNCG